MFGRLQWSKQFRTHSNFVLAVNLNFLIFLLTLLAALHFPTPTELTEVCVSTCSYILCTPPFGPTSPHPRTSPRRWRARSGGTSSVLFSPCIDLPHTAWDASSAHAEGLLQRGGEVLGLLQSDSDSDNESTICRLPLFQGRKIHLIQMRSRSQVYNTTNTDWVSHIHIWALDNLTLYCES